MTGRSSQPARSWRSWPAPSEAGAARIRRTIGPVVDVDQELDSSFVGLLQANRAAITGPDFPQVWPLILASMRIDLLPPDRRALLSTEPLRQDVVLAYWREALEASIPDLDARIDAEMATVRSRRLPFLIVAGHPYDAAYSAWLGERHGRAGPRALQP